MSDSPDPKSSPKDRISKWQAPVYLPRFFSGPDPDRQNHLLEGADKAHPWGFSLRDDEKISLSVFYESAREIIFNVVEGKEVIHFICYSIDPSTVQIAVGSTIETVDATEEDIIATLAHAYINEIPVFPNTPALCERLIHYYKTLFTKGFKAQDEDRKITLKIVDAPNDRFETLNILKYLRPDRQYPSAFLTHIEELYSRERVELERARNLIQSLEQAISKLSAILSEREAPEQRLQECLEENPILFGVEYQAVRKQLKLGSEYQMDFGLERWDGAYDTLEIEPASFKLYTKSNDPSSRLIHAEQQVLDWLRWAAQFPNYAGRDLPGLKDPFGMIIMGRRADLTPLHSERLSQRNRLWRSRLVILTYDDLLARARTMFERITI